MGWGRQGPLWPIPTLGSHPPPPRCHPLPKPADRDGPYMAADLDGPYMAADLGCPYMAADLDGPDMTTNLGCPGMAADLGGPYMATGLGCPDMAADIDSPNMAGDLDGQGGRNRSSAGTCAVRATCVQGFVWQVVAVHGDSGSGAWMVRIPRNAHPGRHQAHMRHVHPTVLRIPRCKAAAGTVLRMSILLHLHDPSCAAAVHPTAPS